MAYSLFVFCCNFIVTTVKIVKHSARRFIYVMQFQLTTVCDVADWPCNSQKVIVCLQYSWPSSDSVSHNKELKMLYHFDYLPAGLFNRVQVCLSVFS